MKLTKKIERGWSSLLRYLFESLFVLARQIIDSSYRKVNLVDGDETGELALRGGTGKREGDWVGKGWYSREVRLGLIPLLPRSTICMHLLN